MYIHETQERIRYADTDQMGYVYYGKYATFYEIGRVEALRAIGVRYKDLETQGVIMPVLECRSRYLLPARYDDLITIRTTVTEMPKVRIVFTFEIYNQANTLLNTGEVSLVFVNRQTNKPTRVPSLLAQALAPYFTA